MEKEHWQKFTAKHSAGTCAYVKSILGKTVSQEEFIRAHQQTCVAKHHSAAVCGRDLYKFLTLYGYIRQAATQKAA